LAARSDRDVLAARQFLEPLGKLIAAASVSGKTLDLSFVIFRNHNLLRGPTAPQIEPDAGSARAVSVKFDYAKFEGMAFFQGVQFGPGTSFQGTEFRARADFRGSTFLGDAYLWNAVFADLAQFMDVPFCGAVFMKGSRFAKSADFSGATFAGLINIDNVRFEALADLSTAELADDTRQIVGVNGRGTIFSAEAVFRNREFTGLTDFEGAVFTIAPDFHGCGLHQATYFPGLGGFPDTATTRAASRYRTLGQAMADMRAHDEEAMFFALQQRALRAQRPFYDPVRLFSWFYDVSSDYGQSLSRPLGLLVGTCAGFVVLYLVGARCHTGSWDVAVPAAFEFCAQQLFRPLAVWSEAGSPKWPVNAIARAHSAWPLILATGQTLLTATWLYMIALGIRWRFRRW
jgi:uncharacterized protein YjbI with pentapeptide repeats